MTTAFMADKKAGMKKKAVLELVDKKEDKEEDEMQTQSLKSRHSIHIILSVTCWQQRSTWWVGSLWKFVVSQSHQ